MDATPIRVVTHNIRYATSHPFKGEEPWSTRLPRLLSQLNLHTRQIPTSFICLQEVLHRQLVNILGGLHSRPTESSKSNDEWAYVGVGRDDGDQAGEYSPILYRPAIWSCEESQTLWLSPTPHVPGSRGWDAACVRILTLAVFKHRESRKQIVVMSTHLDDRGAESRYEAAKIIVRTIDGYTRRELPVVLAGDFNSETSDRAYRYITSEDESGRQPPPLRDLRNLVREEERYGNDDTYTGFGYEGESRKRIDFLFLGGGAVVPSSANLTSSASAPPDSDKNTWRVDGYGVLSNKFDDGVAISDHRAVIGDVALI